MWNNTRPDDQVDWRVFCYRNIIQPTNKKRSIVLDKGSMIQHTGKKEREIPTAKTFAKYLDALVCSTKSSDHSRSAMTVIFSN